MRRDRMEVLTIENAYKDLVSMLNNKKVDMGSYHNLKYYDISPIINNGEYLNRLRKDYRLGYVYYEKSDSDFSKIILAKFTNQIVKGIFVENLNFYSKQSGLTPSGMAKLLGIALSTVSDWYNGVNYPKMDKLFRIATILNVNADMLTGDYFYGDKYIDNKYDNKNEIDVIIQENNELKAQLQKQLDINNILINWVTNDCNKIDMCFKERLGLIEFDVNNIQCNEDCKSCLKKYLNEQVKENK